MQVKLKRAITLSNKGSEMNVPQVEEQSTEKVKFDLILPL